MTRTVATLIGSLGLACAIGASVAAQTAEKKFFYFNMKTDDLIVKGAPYSAESTTRVKQTLADGTRLDQLVTSKVYRDTEGRIRREQAVIGMEALDATPAVRSVIQIVDPVARAIYTLNPDSKTAMRQAVEDPPTVSAPLSLKNRLLGPVRSEDLGTKTIEGLSATGRRFVITIAAGQVGNDRPIEIIDETWMSTELKVPLQTLHRDPRSGDIEYTLTKISRQEPDASLFKVPAGYEIRQPALR